MFNSEIYFGALTNFAQELTAAEERGGPLPAKFDSKPAEACATCLQNIEPPKKALRCSACKAVIYCSAECAKRGWSVPAGPTGNEPTHKMLCGNNKRHMERLPQTQAIIKSFPWGRLESDGSFNSDVARGRFRVLGASGYGYWSHRGGPVPHSETDEIDTSSSAPYATGYLKVVNGFYHLDGKDLTGKKHLSDEEGWKLSPKFIPYRNFSSPAARPRLVTEFEKGIIDWDSWYRWRNLSKESPAALLMDFPMSVYQMIVNCLELTSPNAGQADKRVGLHIHLLGAEVELNFLPLFSELALLLPHHDIKMVLFGAAVARLVKEAKKTPGSLATKSPVFTYEAPPECGSGAISIHLNSASENWTFTNNDRPDALVACNAGLASYREWFPVIQAAHLKHIPFATTEYAEQSAEHQKNMMPIILSGAGVPPCPMEDFKIQLNPFQRPGQRNMPMYRLPNVVNGFTLVVYKNKKTQGKDLKPRETRGEVEVEKALCDMKLDAKD